MIIFSCHSYYVVYISNVYAILGGCVVVFDRMTRLVHIVHFQTYFILLYARIFVSNNLVTLYIRNMPTLVFLFFVNAAFSILNEDDACAAGIAIFLNTGVNTKLKFISGFIISRK